MAHGITDQDSMVSTGKTPWHGLGTRKDHLMTPDEALAEGLDWEVVKRPLAVEHEVDGVKVYNYLNDWVATVRSTDGLPLGAVKPNYTTISNREVAEFQAAVLQVLGKDQRLVETAGSLFGGKVVWFLSHIPRDINLGAGGTIETYQVIAASHNATLPVILKNTLTRVECANTLDMARVGPGHTFKFKHTADWKGKVVQARQAMGMTIKYLDAYEAQAKAMMKRKMTLAEIRAFTEDLFPATADPDTGKVPARAQNRRDAVMSMLNADDLANVRLSAWGAYNAVAAFIDHQGTFRETQGGTREDNRALSILTGQASVVKDQALRLLTK